MSIKYAVLALILEKPRHGYAIRNAFEARLSDVREIGYGQVYQVLAGLEKDGFARGVSTPDGVRRIVYTGTRRGRAALNAWLYGASLERRGFRDDVFLRLLFVGPDHIDGMLRFLAGQILQVKEDLEILRAQHRDLDCALDPLDPVVRMRCVYIEAEILHREADLAAIGVAISEIDRLWPRTGRRRTQEARPGPARESLSASVEEDLRSRSRATTSDGHRWRSRFG